MSQSSGKTSRRSKPPLHASDAMLLDVDGLSVRLGGQFVVENAAFCIHPGEFIGVIGPNGAGKTTLLRSLLGLLQPSKGRVTRTGSLSVGYVPQHGISQNQSVPMSVYEVVRLGAQGSKEKTMQALADVSMAQFAKNRFTDLSGGQQQRVLIAKALAGNPNILFLDEPTTGIDEASQRDFYDIINKLHSSGMAVVMVSHDIDVVLQQVSRVILLNRTVRYDGPPEKFTIEEFLPSFYTSQHRLLHHHHQGKNDA